MNGRSILFIATGLVMSLTLSGCIWGSSGRDGQREDLETIGQDSTFLGDTIIQRDTIIRDTVLYSDTLLKHDTIINSDTISDYDTLRGESPTNGSDSKDDYPNEPFNNFDDD